MGWMDGRIDDEWMDDIKLFIYKADTESMGEMINDKAIITYRIIHYDIRRFQNNLPVSHMTLQRHGLACKEITMMRKKDYKTRSIQRTQTPHHLEIFYLDV